MSQSSSEELLIEFKSLVQQDVSIPVCAMKSLVSVIKNSQSTTWMQLEAELRSAIAILKKCNASDLCGRTKVSLTSGCDLFMKHVSRSFLEYSDFNVCKKELISRGENFAGISETSRSRIAEIGHSFVQDSCTVLIHGNSRVVNTLLLKAAETKQFRVMVTEARPSGDGHEAAKRLSEAGIPTSVILDCAVGMAMEICDLVIVGAEGVMENGGILNKLGTYQVAMIAKMTEKPFYVAVESYKFARMYPLSQRDILDYSSEGGDSQSENGEHFDSPLAQPVLKKPSDSSKSPLPTIDFTPAEYIHLLFTDIGVLTPAAVSDELIRLYQ